MRFSAAAATLALLTGALAGFPAIAETWSYSDGSGQTVTLDAVPTRIVAHANAAAALIPFGIRPVGIYVDSAVEDDKSLEGLDLAGIEIVGEAWGEINVEKVAALKPDLIVAEWWPMEKAWSGLEDGANDASKEIRQLAPVTGPTQGNSIVTLIEDYEALAASLGADLAAPGIAADKAAFETSLAGFQAALADKPDLVVLPVWAGTDALYVASTAGSAELSDFARWGMNLIDPKEPADRGYWEVLSWENADKYQPGLIIVDNRSDATIETAEAQPTWTAMKAAAAGQVGDWPAFWVRNYRSYARALDALSEAIVAADPSVAE